MPPLYAGLTKTGRLSNKINGKQGRYDLFLEKLVRFDIARLSGNSLLTDKEIGTILGKATRYICIVRRKSDYLRKRVELTTGISADWDNSVNNSVEAHKQVLEMMMPDALRVLANQLRNNPTNTVEKRLQTTVALEILDRQGSLPKISRTDSHLKIEHDYSSLDNVSKDLLSSVDGPVQSTEEDKAILQILNANKEFANSDTVSESKQEIAMRILENTKVEGPVN